jgi:hypothetical protein
VQTILSVQIMQTFDPSDMMLIKGTKEVTEEIHKSMFRGGRLIAKLPNLMRPLGSLSRDPD